jgi:hypothetical protein
MDLELFEWSLPGESVEMQREYLWPGRLGRSVLRPYMVGGGRSE